MAKRRKRKSYAGRIILLLMLLVIALCVLGFTLYKDKIAKTVGKKVATTAIEQMIKAETGKSVDINEIKSQMDEEDVEKLDSIVDKYADTDKMKECVDLYKNKGTQAVKDYLKDEVNQEDIDKLKDLYQKYGDTISVSNE